MSIRQVEFCAPPARAATFPQFRPDVRPPSRTTNPRSTPMFRRGLAAVLALSLIGLAMPIPAKAASADMPQRSALIFPINAVSATQGTFTGTLKIVGFTVDNGALVA